jgi:hypothetical protein
MDIDSLGKPTHWVQIFIFLNSSLLTNIAFTNNESQWDWGSDIDWDPFQSISIKKDKHLHVVWWSCLKEWGSYQVFTHPSCVEVAWEEGRQEGSLRGRGLGPPTVKSILFWPLEELPTTILASAAVFLVAGSRSSKLGVNMGIQMSPKLLRESMCEGGLFESQVLSGRCQASTAQLLNCKLRREVMSFIFVVLAL